MRRIWCGLRSSSGFGLGRGRPPASRWRAQRSCVHLFVCLFDCLFVCLLACLLACLFVCLLVCLLLLLDFGLFYLSGGPREVDRAGYEPFV